MTKTNDIIREMQCLNHITDCNTGTRRFFRCWLDGSYNGESHYQANCDFIRSNYKNDKALRGFVISEFCQYLASEHDCTVSTVMSAIKQSYDYPLSKQSLEMLNAELIDDARGLVREEMESEAA